MSEELPEATQALAGLKKTLTRWSKDAKLARYEKALREIADIAQEEADAPDSGMYDHVYANIAKEALGEAK